MKRILVVTLALVAGATVAPTAANATAAEDRIRGGCGFVSDDTVAFATGQETFHGVIDDVSATTTRLLPTDATVTCWIDVNFVEAPGTRFSYSGFGVQAGADRISYTAAPGDIVVECQSVTFADGATQTGCPAALGPFILPPPVVTDLIDDSWAWVISPVACPLLADLAGTYGPVTVAADGDIYVPDPLGVGLNPVVDCPPTGGV